MNELTVRINTEALTNRQLAKELVSMEKTMNCIKGSEWKFAKSIHAIMANELYKDDFESDRAFAEKLGVSKATLSRMKKAVDMFNDCKVGDVKILLDFSVNKVSEMVAIPVESIPDFLSGYGVSASSTIREIREAVACWKEDTAVIEDKTSSKVDEESEESEEAIKTTEADEPISFKASFPLFVHEDLTVDYSILELTLEDLHAVTELLHKRGVLKLDD